MSSLKLCLKREVTRKDSRNSWIWSISGALNRCGLKWNWDTRHNLYSYRQRIRIKYMGIGSRVSRLFKNNWITLMALMRKRPVNSHKENILQWYSAILMLGMPSIFNIRVTGLTIMSIWELMYLYGIIEDSVSVKVIQAQL